MGKILVVAEKPSVGRDYAKVLGCKEKGEGCLIGPQYVVTWAVGHLIELCEPEAYDEKFKRWNYRDLPIIPQIIQHQVIKNAKKQYGIVKKLMNSKEIDRIVCGTDSGREGELIFRYIYLMAKCKKPFDRLWVSSMTEEAITKGFQTLKNGHEYDNLYESARCRSEADWLVGINGSRAYTIRYDVLLSIGRVQTPTLAMIVKRQREIDEFVPKDYFEVKLEHEKDRRFSSTWFKLEPDGKSRDTHIDEIGRAQQLCDMATATGKAVVKSVTKNKKKQHPPLLYDLTELQRDGNRKYGFSASKVLSLAQDLYEKHKLLTYPRTDSRYLSDDMKDTVRNTLHAINIPEFHSALMGIPQLNFTKRIIDNSKITDHHAIIPTPKKPDLSELSEDEAKIYRLVAWRLIEVFYPAYEYEMTEAVLAVEAETFLAKGKVVTQAGYTALHKEKEDKDEELPELKKGEEVTICSGKVEKKQTKPPSPFTEATLLTAMEYAGKYIEEEALREQMDKLSLGTPATRASIIERLLNVGYIQRKGKALIPTQKGKDLISILPDQLKSPEMTGKWERALDKIYQGSMDPNRFMQSIYRYVQFIVGAASEEKPVQFEKEEYKKKGRKAAKQTASSAFGNCPVCKTGQIYKNSKSYYCSGWRKGCKFTVWQDSLDRYGLHLSDEHMQRLLKGEQLKENMTMPQTHEQGSGELYLGQEGRLEIKNFKAGAIIAAEKAEKSL